MAKARRSDRAKWLKIVQQYQSSGKKQIQFAEERGLNIWTFRGWLYRFREEGAVKGESKRRGKRRPKFVQVRVTGNSSTGNGSCPVCIRAPGGVSVDFHHAPSAEYLATVLAHLL